MKAIIFAAAFQIFFISVTFSQKPTPTLKNEFWSIGFHGGGVFNLHNGLEQDNKFYAGYNGGIELGYNFQKEKTAAAIYVSYSAYSKKVDEEYVNDDRMKIEYIEVSIGPKFLIGDSYFVQAGLGNYTTASHIKSGYNGNNYYYSASSHSGLGFNAGGGRRFKLTSNTDLILSGRFHITFPLLETVEFVTLNAGVIINGSSKDIQSINNEGRASVTASGGVTIPSFPGSSRYKTSGYVALEIDYNKGTASEMYTGFAVNHFYYENETVTSHKETVVEISTGPRFFVGENRTKAIFELGGGIYIFDIERIRGGDLYIGLNAGAGVLHYISKKIGIILKAKYHLFPLSKDAPDPYLNTGAGLRWDL